MKTLTRTCVLAAVLSIATVVACVNPTAGVPITLHLAFEPLGSRSFATVTGWEVELDEARAVIGPVYAHSPSSTMAWRGILGPSRALAHGGHEPLDGRVVRAELLEPRVVDALSGDPGVTLDGLAGPVGALMVVLDVPASAEGLTRGRAVWVAGVARRDGDEVRFAGGLVVPEGRQRRVDGIEVTGVPLREGSRLVVGLDVRAWLVEADFAGLAAGPAGVARIEGTQPERALWLGARSAASWRARVEDSNDASEDEE